MSNETITCILKRKTSIDLNNIQEQYDNAINSNNTELEINILYTIIEDLNKQLASTTTESKTSVQNKLQELQIQYNKQSQTIGSLRKENETLKQNIKSHSISPDIAKMKDIEEKLSTVTKELSELKVFKQRIAEVRKKNNNVDRALRTINI